MCVAGDDAFEFHSPVKKIQEVRNCEVYCVPMDNTNYIIRSATQADSEKIALLHAISWKNAYRGLVPDHLLDNNLEEERKQYWKVKMSKLGEKDFVLIAEFGNEVIGFGALMDKPEKGFDALIDNLHVSPDKKGQGIGRRLMKEIFTRLLQTGRKSAYLWVLKGNDAAEKFYEACAGKRADISTDDFGGRPVYRTRFVWPLLKDF